MQFDLLEKIFDIKINDKTFFQKALTHPSYTKENDKPFTECYERLEFLGDAVMKLFVSELLYRKYPDENEGKLTKIRAIIISDATLAEFASQIGLDEFIILSKNSEKLGDRKRQSVKACAFEAVIGAFYLDGKQNEIKEFLLKIFNEKIDFVCANIASYNAKELLQEYTQGKTKTIPQYNLIRECGPAHNPSFEIEVVYEGEVLSNATGKSKKDAEQKCAYEACKKLGVING